MKRIVFHIDDHAYFLAELAKQTTPEGVEAIMEGIARAAENSANIWPLCPDS